LNAAHADRPKAAAKIQHLSGHVPKALQMAIGVAAAITANQIRASCGARERIAATINKIEAPSIIGPHKDDGAPLTVCIIM
jgi:hypothetical protein